MNKYEIEKLAELKSILAQAAKLWRAEYSVEIITELHLSEVDTSSDAAMEYKPGAISQVITPSNKVEYMIYQPEELGSSYLIEMPNIPVIQLDATASAIQFHIDALRAILIAYAPDEHDWNEAIEARDKERGNPATMAV